MACANENILNNPSSINLENELQNSNARIMAIQDSNNVLDQIGGSVQFGKRQDLFWIVLSVILGSVLILSKLFGKKTKRRR